jgi:hypothetical protein
VNLCYATDLEERQAQIERMIECYGAAKQRRLLRRAMRLWRLAEVHQQLVRLEAAPERVH